jgi:hypothetical protein
LDKEGELQPHKQQPQRFPWPAIQTSAKVQRTKVNAEDGSHENQNPNEWRAPTFPVPKQERNNQWSSEGRRRNNQRIHQRLARITGFSKTPMPSTKTST